MPSRQTVGSSMPPKQREKRQLIQQTLDFWQPRTPQTLAPEDARQIVENFTGFFRILREWERAEQRSASPVPDAGGAASAAEGERPA
jgi:hypothetical protein